MSRECLIIFTRYPEAGKTKTRLIPFLGAEAAANLQRRMTEYAIALGAALRAIAQIKQLPQLSVEVHFAGGNLEVMANWLGADLVYQPQGDGDLGKRMAQAFQSALARHDRVVIIGSDCPSLNSQLLQQAFEALTDSDLVLGPATDGGYYLIGLRRLIPELFTGISWSTSEVLPQTVAIAESLGVAIAFLPTLSDVDYPEDIPDFLIENN